MPSTGVTVFLCSKCGEERTPCGIINRQKSRLFGIKNTLLLLVMFCTKIVALSAATYVVPSLTGDSLQATINTAYAAGKNNIVYVPAGTYDVATPINYPCGNNLTITGPVATPATAILEASFSGNAIFTLVGCKGATITYLQMVNTGGIYVGNASAENITIAHNQFYNLPSSIGEGPSGGTAGIYLDGSIDTTILNFTASWNTFGDSTSCAAVFASTVDQGGNCGGILAFPGILVNASIEHNVFNHVEEGIHLNQLCNGCTRGAQISITQNSDIRYNYFFNWHRIGAEIQTGVVGSAIVVSDNVFASPLNPFYGTMFLSLSCCTSGRNYLTTTPPNPADVAEDNLEYGQGLEVGGFWTPVIGIEYSGGAGSRANSNFIEGDFSNQINWGNGVEPWYVEDNYLCGPYNNEYVTREVGDAPPTIINNTEIATCSQQTSGASTISPPSGTYGSPQTVSLSNTSRNTSTYYTTDGSSPVPGEGTTMLYTAPFVVNLPAVVKAVGMWGVPPQPTSYSAPFGFVPSDTAIAAYVGAGQIVLTGVSLSNLGSVHSLIAGRSVQMTATCIYSDGSTTTCNTTDTNGNAVTGWSSSSGSVAVSTTGLVTAITPGNADITATVGSTSGAAWTIAVSAPSISLSSVSIVTADGASSVAAGSTDQLVATCGYSDGSITNCTSTDINGNAVSTWSSSVPAAATVSNTGSLTALAAGNTALAAIVVPDTLTQWGALQFDVAGSTYPGYINATYMVLGTQAGGFSATTCSFYLPVGPIAVGSKYDCGLIPAPTPTTQASSWQCWYTYTVTSATSPGGWVTGALSDCGTLPSGSAWWVGVVTNQSGQSPAGFYDCGGSCAGPAPITGSGNYPYRYIPVPYGVYTGMNTAMQVASNQQASQYVTLGQPSVTSNSIAFTVTGGGPALTGVYLTTKGNASSVVMGGTLQCSAYGMYSDGSTHLLPDSQGNTVALWNTTNHSIAKVSSLGKVTALNVGTVNVTANVGTVANTTVAIPVTITVVAPSQ